MIDIIAAEDSAAALQEVLDLLFLSAERVGGREGAAMARGALLAQDRLAEVREHLSAALPA
ncbi:hypothetical protein ACEPPZ_11290 [Paracoccus yeei]|uniref:hypothetical protein n=1 Tax=Paracoccus yeei TaxID=147645 RepID=UPI0037D0C5F4